MRVAGPGSCPLARKRHCGTCTSSEACCASHASPSRLSMTGYVVVPDLWVIDPRPSQSGADEASCFSKNDPSATPFGQRFRVTARPAMCGTMTSAMVT